MARKVCANFSCHCFIRSWIFSSFQVLLDFGLWNFFFFRIRLWNFILFVGFTSNSTLDFLFLQVSSLRTLAFSFCRLFNFGLDFGISFCMQLRFEFDFGILFFCRLRFEFDLGFSFFVGLFASTLEFYSFCRLRFEFDFGIWFFFLFVGLRLRLRTLAFPFVGCSTSAWTLEFLFIGPSLRLRTLRIFFLFLQVLRLDFGLRFFSFCRFLEFGISFLQVASFQLRNWIFLFLFCRSLRFEFGLWISFLQVLYFVFEIGLWDFSSLEFFFFCRYF